MQKMQLSLVIGRVGINNGLKYIGGLINSTLSFHFLISCSLLLFLVTWCHEVGLYVFGDMWSGYLKNSLIIVICGGLSASVIGVTAAYFAVFHNFIGRSWICFSLSLPLAVPSYLTAFVYGKLFEYGSFLHKAYNMFGPLNYYINFRSPIGAIFVSAISTYPYIYVAAYIVFSGMSNTVIVSRSLGRSSFNILLCVLLPCTAPSILAGVLLAVAEIFSDFGVASEMAVDTVIVGIYREYFVRYNFIGALQVSLIVLLLIITTILTFGGRRKYENRLLYRKYCEVVALSAGKSIIATIFCGCIVIAGFFLPLIILLYWCCGVDVHFFTINNVASLMNTCFVGGMSSVMMVGIAFTVFYFLHSRGIFMFAECINRIAGLGYAMPGTIVALLMLIGFSGINNFCKNYFNIDGAISIGTIFALFICYVVRFAALPFGMLYGGFCNIDKSVLWLSSIAGKSRYRSLIDIYMPLLQNSITACVFLLFIDIVKELPITLIVRPPNFDTLPTRVYDLVADERVVDAAVPSVMLVMVILIFVRLINYRHLSRC